MPNHIAMRKQDLLNSLENFNTNSLSRDKDISQILSHADSLQRNRKGLDLLYNIIELFETKGFFAHSSWAKPEALVPSLVEGTLRSGFPMIIYETLSELRMLRIAKEKMLHKQVSARDAYAFLKQVIIHNLHYTTTSEAGRHTEEKLSNALESRIILLFEFLIDHIPLSELKEDVALELKEISDQRPLVSLRFRRMLEISRDHFSVEDSDESSRILRFYTNSVYGPTEISRNYPEPDAYIGQVQQMDSKTIESEASEMASMMNQTGLVSPHHLGLVQYMVEHRLDGLPQALGLNAHGRADYELHKEFINEKILAKIGPERTQSIYGLSRMLNRSLLSRKSIFNAFRKLMSTRMHPDIKRRLLKADPEGSDEKAMQVLIEGLIGLLGQPLGVGQGFNPTCQSARGLSMWSRHSPGKLLNLLISAVASNELRFRFQNEIIHSKGIVDEQKFDYDLDPVSVVLVPHLDDIYGQMMSRAQLKFPGQDPHVTVNPAFYGLWIQTGFISCYNALLNVIENYDHFVKLFYAAFHPMYNGAASLIYPVPLGIFITNSQAELLGFHAVSLLRVDKTETGSYRAYFFNPNNEGRQNWGQGIRTTVSGNGERYGESSLPFHEFLSRVYAYHYNSFEAESNLEYVHSDELVRVEELARESWGKKYFWDKN